MTDAMRRLRELTRATWSLGWFFVAYVLAALSTVHVAVAILLAIAACAGCFALAWARFTEAGRARFTSNRLRDWPGTLHVMVLLVAVSTAGFASLTTGLYSVGVGATTEHLTGLNVLKAAYQYYLWHLADAVPLLKIPETLNWTLTDPFIDKVSGSFALLYSSLVIIPTVYFISEFAKRLIAEASDGPSAPTTKRQ